VPQQPPETNAAFFSTMSADLPSPLRLDPMRRASTNG
jgi:hypothetical protein